MNELLNKGFYVCVFSIESIPLKLCLVKNSREVTSNEYMYHFT